MKFIKTLVILIIFPVLAYSQTIDSENSSLKGRWAYGENNVVKIDGTDLYMGSGGVLTTGFLNNDGDILSRGRVQFNHKINDIAVDGNMVYVALGFGGVKIVDVTDRSKPFVTDSVKFTQPNSHEVLNYTRLNISDGYLFLIAPKWGFMCDYSDPHHIYVKNNFSGVDGASINYLVKKDNFIYQAQNGTSTGLVVYQRYGSGEISISSVHSYYQESSTATENAVDIQLANGLIYIADANYGMFIISIGEDGTSYPHSHISGSVKRILLKDNFAYMLDPFNKVKVIDITNPYEAAIVKEITLPDPTDILMDFDMSSDSKMLIASRDKGFYHYDFSDPLLPTQEDFFKGWTLTQDIFVAGNYIYVAAGSQGLKVLQNTEVNGEIIPIEISSFSPSSDDTFDKIIVYESYAYVRTQNGIKSIDVTNPSAPVAAGFYTTSNWVNNFTAKDGYLYCADGEGLTILNIADPTNITLAGTYSTPGYCTDVEVLINNAYLTDETKGLRILNVSNPASISEIGFYDDDNEDYEALQVQENYTYVIDNAFGMKIFDTSTPSNPTLVSTFQLNYNESWASYYGFSVSGSYAYVTINRDGNTDIVKQININNPAYPTEKGYFTMGGYVSSLVSDDYYFYVSDNEDGIYILQNDNEDALPMCRVRGRETGIWDCDTIFVIGDILVPEGETLTINSGTKVFFVRDCNIDVDGTLLALGTEQDSIKFFSKNTTEGWRGITFYDSDVDGAQASQFKYCQFINGNANGEDSYAQRGGAISIVDASNVSIKNSLFYHNKADLMGGAIYLENALPEIDSCQIDDNSVLTGVGGAIAMINSSAELKHLSLSGNLARDGGAIAIQDGSPIISNTVFGNNGASGLGQVIHMFDASPSLVNITTASNGSETDVVIYGMSNSSPTIINSILWDGPDQHEIVLAEGAPTVTYSDVRNASAEEWFGTGCIEADPLFAFNPGYQLSSTEYGFPENSPAIDAGHPESVDISLSALTGKGASRADMGAYGGGETTIHVGTNDIVNALALDIYPNPTQDFVTLDLSRENFDEFHYAVYTIFGQLLEESHVLRTNRIKIDLSAYKTGIYFIKVKMDGEVYMRQIIKK